MVSTIFQNEKQLFEKVRKVETKSMDWFLYDNGPRHERAKRQSCHHITTSPLICLANQLTGFYMMQPLAFNEFNKVQLKVL